MFEVSVFHTFCAGHALRNYTGKCANVHGHNYRVQLIVQGTRLNEAGLLIDFADLKRAVREVSERIDHRFVNEIPPFDVINPSTENMAQWFYQEVGRLVPMPEGSRITEVRLWESDIQYASYRE
jgi:6-pyruvoyltetrahydropterin/6-carboxytetrahydropterin synthase